MRIAALLMLLISSTAFAETATDILKEVRNAMAPARWAAIAQIDLTGELQLGGMKGRIHEVASTRDARRTSRFDLDVVAGSNGFDGAAPWSADAAGLVDVDESIGGKQKAISASYVANRLYLLPEFAVQESTVRRADEHDVLTITPEGGERVELWIDRETHLVARTVLPQSRETTHWLDYRKVNGLMLPYRIESDDGSNNPQSIIVERYELRPTVDAARLMKPRSRASDTVIEPNATSLAAHVEGGHVYVRASINDAAPSLFILDTGASINVLTPEAAKTLGVVAQGSLNATGVGESQVSVSLATIPRVRVGAATLTKQSFAIIPLPALAATRDGKTEPVAGLLGYDFFRRLRVTIDHARETVRLEPLQACALRPASSVPLFLDENRVPRIPLTVGGVEALWSLDVGDASSLTMSANLANRLAIPTDAGVPTIGLGGVGGVARARLLEFDEVRISSYDLPDSVIAISDQKTGAFAEPDFAGNIGYGVLRQFVLTFDYECRTLALAPSTQFGMPAPYNAAGISWREEDGEWRVLHVIPNSPAATAGIEIGDLLVLMNGIPESELTRQGIGELQSRAPGSELRLRVRRGAEERAFTLTLDRFVPRFVPAARTQAQ